MPDSISSAPSDNDIVAVVAVVAVVARSPDGVAVSAVEAAFSGTINRRALQRRLKALVDSARLIRRGSRRWTIYLVPAGTQGTILEADAEQTLSRQSRLELRRLDRSVSERPVASYRSDYLREYLPGETTWLSETERAYLRRIGTVIDKVQPAGTYACRIADRLLIDLSWNSSRLEGNTYSLLDSRRLIAIGVEVEGHDPREARMIRNHRDAIEFLIE